MGRASAQISGVFQVPTHARDTTAVEALAQLACHSWIPVHIKDVNDCSYLFHAQTSQKSGLAIPPPARPAEPTSSENVSCGRARTCSGSLEKRSSAAFRISSIFRSTSRFRAAVSWVAMAYLEQKAFQEPGSGAVWCCFARLCVGRRAVNGLRTALVWVNDKPPPKAQKAMLLLR